MNVLSKAIFKGFRRTVTQISQNLPEFGKNPPRTGRSEVDTSVEIVTTFCSRLTARCCPSSWIIMKIKWTWTFGLCSKLVLKKSVFEMMDKWVWAEKKWKTFTTKMSLWRNCDEKTCDEILGIHYGVVTARRLVLKLI